MMNKKDFSIVCIGAGNVATHLAQALQQKGFHLSQIYSRTQESVTNLQPDTGISTSFGTDIRMCVDHLPGTSRRTR